MSLILSLETSTEVCSVALHRNNELVKEISIQKPQAHASQLAPLIKELLDQTNSQYRQLTAVAVSAGPGSYTGLRIGTSTAKGICYAMEIPLIAIPTLELLARQLAPAVHPNTLLCPMIDAKRMEVYTQVFTQSLRSVRPIDAVIVDGSTFEELLTGQPVLFFGNGAAKCRAVISHLNAQFLDGIFPSAGAMGLAAAEKLAKGETEDLVNFRPQYLKDFIAKKAQSFFN